jgi:hypothetical protein
MDLAMPPPMSRPPRTVRLIATLALIALLLPACSQRQSPEDEVRAQIRDAVAAAEQKSVGTLRDMLSEQYTDSEGRDKRAVEGLLRVHFLRNESLHFYTRIHSVTLPRPDRAEAVVVVAMAGVPIASEEELAGLRADLHRFEIEFAREDRTWRVRRAAWQRAEPGEFLRP